MIESRFWKDDLVRYAKIFKPVANPPYYSEKRQVNFEKDVIVSLFMVRKLGESLKLSSKTLKRNFTLYSSLCQKQVHNMNFWDIGELYDLEVETKEQNNVQFISNQLIHGQAIYAYRDDARNWAGIYTCSDFERNKKIYKIPISTIIEILVTASEDYPTKIDYEYCSKKQDYLVSTD
jgi:sporulation protein YlmC with PRC-barrel domain